MNSQINHILVADDDTDDLELFQSAIDESCAHISLTTATDGEILLNLLDNISKPDAIFLDLNMPRKNGKECLVEIRNKSEFKDVPVIIFSTSNQPAEINFCMTNGANHYITKPQTFTAMKSIIDDLCSGQLFS